jgi:hypothetical protein
MIITAGPTRRPDSFGQIEPTMPGLSIPIEQAQFCHCHTDAQLILTPRKFLNPTSTPFGAEVQSCLALFAARSACRVSR